MQNKCWVSVACTHSIGGAFVMFKKLFKFLIIEVTGWFFIILGIVCVMVIPKLVDGSWLLGIPVLILFIILYLVALFASSKILKVNDDNPSEAATD